MSDGRIIGDWEEEVRGSDQTGTPIFTIQINNSTSRKCALNPCSAALLWLRQRLLCSVAGRLLVGCRLRAQQDCSKVSEASTASKKLLALSALLFRIRSQNEESSTRHGLAKRQLKKLPPRQRSCWPCPPCSLQKKSDRRVVHPARTRPGGNKRSFHRVKEVFGRKQSLKERRWGRVFVLKQQQTMSAVAPSARKGQKAEKEINHDESDKHFMIAYEKATQRISKESDRKQTPIGHTGLVNVGNSCFIAAFGLYGLTDHIGQQLDRGHYTSSVANFATKDKEWLNFNDAICKPCDAPSSNKNVYILHYQQIHADSGSDAEAADSGTSHDSESSGESGTDSEDQDGSDAEAAGSGTPHDSESSGESGTDREEDQE
ncbi:hypothetical protein niasHS_016771 [Heterodera schachtii]|uniref:Peptidase C19 ubiquitin carboxyl-terminal hydrolase domain-containing protein n=1 Tax=Heterodera schachtii TaxID=97005 RepID=A0ABD2HZB2_HETSC